MKYQTPAPLSRAEINLDLNSGDTLKIANAVISAALHDADLDYVEAIVVRFLSHPDPWVRGVSAVAASHIARIHRALSVNEIVPLIEHLLEDPSTNGKARDALDDIETFLK
jgi:hypothetical protein